MAKPKRVQNSTTKDKNLVIEKKTKAATTKGSQKKKPPLKKEKIKAVVREEKQKNGNPSKADLAKEKVNRKRRSTNAQPQKQKRVKKDVINKEPVKMGGYSQPISNSQPQGVRSNLMGNSVNTGGSQPGRKRSLPSSAEAGTVKKKKIIDRRSPRYQRIPGVVLTLGQGDVGQLGLGPDVMEKSRPALVRLENIVDIYAGGMHTVCLSADGEIHTFGCNDEGALGRDTSEEGSEFFPGKVDIPGKVIQICAGDSHTAALTEEGQAYAWGTFRDSSGSMGLLTPSVKFQPQMLLAGITVVKIASGSDHLVLLTSEGHLYTCGCAEQGQLGRVAECFSSRGGRKGLGLLLNPGLVFTRRLQGKELFFDDVWTGAYCTYARVKTSGDIYVCGLNNYFQLGTEDMRNRYVLEKSMAFRTRQWQEIIGGQHHTVCLDAAGQVYAIGRHEYGRLGLGDTSQDVIVPTVIPDLQNINCIGISCGIATSYAVAEDGSVYAWGMGTNGALGTGDEDDKPSPIRMTGKQLENRKAVAVSGGGQHCVILAVNKQQD